MKKLLVVFILVGLIAGCSLNETLTKADNFVKKANEKADKIATDAANRVIEVVGVENMKKILASYDDMEAAATIVGLYEELSGEALSARNKQIMSAILYMSMKQIRAKFNQQLETKAESDATL